MNLPISIITVAYNSESTIRRTIESIVTQTFQDFEYIVIDGGSTDRTNEIVEEYKEILENKLTHITEPDKGIYDAMNKGIVMAKGELIGLLNSDDYYFNNTLEIIYQKFINTDKKTVISGEMLFVSKTGEQFLKTSEKRFLQKIKHYKNGVRHPATFVPNAIYKKIGLFNTSFTIGADADLIYRIYKAGYPFLFINSTLTVMSDGGVSNNNKVTRQILYDKRLFLDMYCKSKIMSNLYLFETALRLFIKKVAYRLISVYRNFD